MGNEDLTTMVSFLESTNRFGDLIAKYNENKKDRSLWFEIAFAYWFENEGYVLEYETNANPENKTSVDFRLKDNNYIFLFELLRVENSDEIGRHIKQQQEENKLFKSYELLLSSDQNNPYFKTAAQIIRLQEKLLEKVNKFTAPHENQFNIIVADCSNIHIGMIDSEDVRIALFGKSCNPIWQEFWDGNRLLGIFEKEYNRRNSDEFKQKIGAVIIVPKLEPGALRKAMVVVNPYFESDYENILVNALTKIKPLVQLSIVKRTL